MIPLAEVVAQINAAPPPAGPVTAGALRKALAAGRIDGYKVSATLWLVDPASAVAWASTRKIGRPRKALRDDG